ncbi:MAG: nucleoside hydrolase [Saprospiraceae bacterium]|nr:nucleoside hydrolase [Saprospiraceae bacterium]
MITRYSSLVLLLVLLSCGQNQSSEKETDGRIPIMVDTDANNELDDQHALAYVLLNSDVFDVQGVTVNHTAVGTIQNDYEEAKRVMILCDAWGKIPLKVGVDSSRYPNLKDQLEDPYHEGYEAVNFIIEQARKWEGEKLLLAPIGKLTNIALALTKDPEIVEKVKVVWLGSNYYGKDGPDGEHNLRHDPDAYNAVISSGVDFTMVTVRYGAPSGTDAVAVHVNDIKRIMPGLVPSSKAVTGRHGGTFTSFGDYSINLFVNYTDGTRPLFDMALFAILKNSSWAKSSMIVAPKLMGDYWSGLFENRRITIVENFNKEAILGDFFETMRNPNHINF